MGGPARARVILLLAAVLALDSADSGTVGAVAPQLEADLGINHTELGLLASVATGVGAVVTLPMGVLADRFMRVRILVVTAAVWAAAMTASGLSTSYGWLLLSRLALGAALAAAGPVVASLIGDLFPPGERARVYGWVLAGEVLGAGFGLVVSADVAAVLSWRYAFFLLAAASGALAYGLHRLLPEPARGGQGQLRAGDRSMRTADGDVVTMASVDPEAEPGHDTVAGGDTGTRMESGEDDDESADHRPAEHDEARRAVDRAGVKPVASRVLRTDPARMPLWDAMVYLLRIPTIRILIIASSIGYFFFAGLRVFAVIFVEQQYGLPLTVITALVPILGVGALLGLVFGGGLSDSALSRGRLTARVTAPAIGYVAAAVFFAPGLFTTSIALALPLFTAGAAALAAANPPLDAARLDIVSFRLWGRGESVRTFLRLAAETAAPVTFGFVADELGGPGGHQSAAGLRDALLIMLVPLLLNGVIVWFARRTYPSDVATAAASDANIRR